MYYSKKLRKFYLSKLKEHDQFCVMRLVGNSGLEIDEVASVASLMFKAWNRVVKQRQNDYAKNFTGYLRKFFVVKHRLNDTNIANPYTYTLFFKFLLTSEKKFDYKSMINTRVSWYRAWAMALKTPSPDVKVFFDLYSKGSAEGSAEKILNNFLDVPSFTPITDLEKQLRDDILGGDDDFKNKRHRLFATSGVFREFNK